MPNAEETKITQEELEQGKRHAHARKRSYGIILALCAAIIGLWYLWGRYLVLDLAEHLRNKLPPVPPTTAITLEELGQVGDLFGGINALFGALAFIGVACAAYYQRQTFLQQRADSAANKTALEESRLVNAALLSNAKHELFISVFLRTVEELHKTIDKIHLKIVPSIFPSSEYTEYSMLERDKGLKKIETLLSDMAYEIKRISNRTSREFKTAKSKIDDLYYTTYASNSGTLGPFIRNFYNTFYLIEESGMTYTEQNKYSQIALASIQENILIIIMMNGLTDQGKKLKRIVEKYGLLATFPAGAKSAAVQEIAQLFYERTAFLEFNDRQRRYDPAGWDARKKAARQAHTEELRNNPQVKGNNKVPAEDIAPIK